MFLEIKGIKKHFGEGDSRIEVLKGIDMEIEKGELPPMRYSPVMRQPGTRSFIRLNILRNVDFPQPDGPISAVTFFSGISMFIS